VVVKGERKKRAKRANATKAPRGTKAYAVTEVFVFLGVLVPWWLKTIAIARTMLL
jgi:hypothetical protein